MKAALFRGVRDFGTEDIPDPRVGPHEVLLQPLSVGVCGTDVHILEGHYPARAPVVLGHEVSARVVQLGHDVTSVALGELVTVEPHKYCRACAYCRLGMEHMCTNKEAFGVHLNGGMADLMVAPALNAYGVPDGISASVAALTEPLSCCLHGMDRLATRSGLPFLVIGCGPAGAILIALARLAGMNPVVAADTRADRRDLAKRMGADVVLDAGSADFEASAVEATRGLGFPYLVDAVGSATVWETCLRLSSRGAAMLAFGVAPPDARARISPNEIYTKEITILGTAVNPFTYSRAVGLLERLPLGELAVATFPLGQANEAIEAVRQGASDKVQISPAA